MEFPLVSHATTHGRWFSPGTPASSTTKAGRHDIAESGFKTPKIKSNQIKSHATTYQGREQVKDLILMTLDINYINYLLLYRR